MRHNPWYYWWKARKWFKRPRAHLVRGEYGGYFGLPISANYHGVLNFFCVGLGWKEKYGYPRHEWDPVICVTLTLPFKTGKRHVSKSYWLGWVFNWVNPRDPSSYTASVATWEAILDVVAYKRSINYARERNVWHDGNEKITIDKNLRNGKSLQQ